MSLSTKGSEEGERQKRGRREEGAGRQGEGGGPKEGQRLSTELGASGGDSENKSRVCCFRDVNQTPEEKLVKGNVGCSSLFKQCSGKHCAQTEGTQRKERELMPVPTSGKRVRAWFEFKPNINPSVNSYRVTVKTEPFRCNST